MTGAKLSGALLVRKESRTATMPAQNLSAILHDAEEKARGGPVLVWSARPDDEAEPNAAEDAGDAVHCAAEAPQATDFDPPAVRGPAHRWMVFPAAAAAVAILTLGGVVLLTGEGKHPGEAALPVAPATALEKLASGGVEPELRSPAKATIAPSQGAPDSAAANAAPATVTSKEILPDLPLTDAPRTAQTVAPTDPAIASDASPPVPRGSGGTPSANPSVGAANSTTAPTEPLGSAALNSTLVARGDALFVIGNFSAARMFYERAANAGHGQAALQLGESYDPAFLARSRFIGARANPAMAAYWYQRARELGVPEADMLLAAMAVETAHLSP